MGELGPVNQGSGSGGSTAVAEPQRRDYDERKRQAAAANAAQSREGRDIGSIPAVVDPARREHGGESLFDFGLTYFPARFPLESSPDHLRVVAIIETVIRRGGLFAVAMPRGSGKTAWVVVAAIWALVYCLRRFVAILAATKSKATGEIMASIKSELENNERLGDDFPEICYPIRCLEGIANRQRGQLSRGRRTLITMTADTLILPTIENSPASGSVVRACGMTGGEVRGMFVTSADGTVLRPDLLIPDDPQTHKSAHSVTGNKTRESLLVGDALGMAGPGRKISAVMPCTVITPDDMVSRMLDRQRNPEWQGVRTQMLNAMPLNEELWAEYAELRSAGLRGGDGGAAATEFYRQHQMSMDAGAEPAWPARFNPDELSAIQHAMNLKLRNEEAFFAEYQNAPLTDDEDDDILTAAEIAAKTNKLPRREIPSTCDHLTAFIDVHAKLLYWMVVAWTDRFDGYIIDYGCYPDQRAGYFALATAKRTMGRVHRGTGREGAIYASLGALSEKLLQHEFRRDDGAILQITRCLVDSGWETNTVYAFCKAARNPILQPSRGIFVGGSSKPWGTVKRKPGEKRGEHWTITAAEKRRGMRHVAIDANYWKSFVHARLAVAMADPGCLSLFEPDRAAGSHRLLADHIAAEHRTITTGHGRSVAEWKLPPNRPDNHWFDCLVGCAVGASMNGVGLFEATRPVAAKKRKRKTLAELRAEAVRKTSRSPR